MKKSKINPKTESTGKNITKKELEGLAAIHCTQSEMAGFFQCHRNTIDSRIKEFYGCNFATFIEMFSARGKVSLRRTAFRKALAGDNEMLKLHLSNHCGMSMKADGNFPMPPEGGSLEWKVTVINAPSTND